MWDDAIPERTLVVLSGRDILSPTTHLNAWLTEHTRAQVGRTLSIATCAGVPY